MHTTVIIFIIDSNVQKVVYNNTLTAKEPIIKDNYKGCGCAWTSIFIIAVYYNWQNVYFKSLSSTSIT